MLVLLDSFMLVYGSGACVSVLFCKWELDESSSHSLLSD